MPRYFERDIPLIIFVPRDKNESQVSRISHDRTNGIKNKNKHLKTLCSGTILSFKKVYVEENPSYFDVCDTEEDTAATNMSSSDEGSSFMHETRSLNEPSIFNKANAIEGVFRVYDKNTLFSIKNKTETQPRGRRRELHPSALVGRK